MQSDNASNYRDPTSEIDCCFIGTRLFSVEGMGKGQVDGNAATAKGKLKRMRDEGNGIESADDLLAMGSRMDLDGQIHAKLKLRRGNEDSGIKGRDSVNRNFGMWTIDEGSITFFESLDVLKSKASMATTGRAVGYGPGVKMTLAEFNEKQRTQIAPTGATLEMADGSERASPNPRERLGRGEKKKKQLAAEEKRSGAALLAAEKREALRAKEEAPFARDIDQCARCKKKFLSKGQFIQHSSKWCPSRAELKEQRRRERHLPTILNTMDALAIEQRTQRIDALSEVQVTLKASKKESAAVGIGLKDGIDGDFHVVDAVSGLAEASAQIGQDFIVVGLENSTGKRGQRCYFNFSRELKFPSFLLAKAPNWKPIGGEHLLARSHLAIIFLYE